MQKPHMAAPDFPVPIPPTPASFFSPLTFSPRSPIRIRDEDTPVHLRAPLPYHPPPATRPLPSAEQSIPHLREALTNLECQMASLMSERTRLETALAHAVRLQSPVHRLPRELLASIFRIGVLDMEEEDPLMLATLPLVCTQWRQVALDTPALWARVAVGTHHSLETARRKLARAMGAPLDVCVDFNPPGTRSGGGGGGGDSTEGLVRAMDILTPAIPRWRSFR